ncbi:MAG: hypothetical protein H6703_05570 [Myxococcales bacterium]|nr:hypothetical protein [Myxococcales bacterium]
MIDAERFGSEAAELRAFDTLDREEASQRAASPTLLKGTLRAGGRAVPLVRISSARPPRSQAQRRRRSRRARRSWSCARAADHA